MEIFFSLFWLVALVAALKEGLLAVCSLEPNMIFLMRASSVVAYAGALPAFIRHFFGKFKKEKYLPNLPLAQWPCIPAANPTFGDDKVPMALVAMAPVIIAIGISFLALIYSRTFSSLRILAQNFIVFCFIYPLEEAQDWSRRVDEIIKERKRREEGKIRKIALARQKVYFKIWVILFFFRIYFTFWMADGALFCMELACLIFHGMTIFLDAEEIFFEKAHLAYCVKVISVAVIFCIIGVILFVLGRANRSIYFFLSCAGEIVILAVYFMKADLIAQE